MFQANVRFNYKPKGERGPGTWYNPGDPVSDEVAKAVDKRCVIDGSGGLGGYPAGGSMEQVVDWVAAAADEPAEVKSRAEHALDIEQRGKARKTLVNYLTDVLASLRGPGEGESSEGDASEGEGE